MLPQKVLPRGRLPLLAGAASLLSCPLSGCLSPDGGGGPPPFTVQPQVTGVAEGKSISFTTPGSVDTRQAVWNFNGTSAGSQGSFTPSVGSSVVYTAPAAPPLYPGSPDPLVQGTVTLRANLVGDTADAITFHVIGPAVVASVSPATATVTLGGTVQLYGYAVGAVNNAVIWSVNDVPGGNGQLGTISPIGVYTAPTAVPTSGKAVTVKLVSVVDQTSTASTAITLQATP